MGIRNLDIDALRSFVAIADTGSFTRGSVQVYRNQSTVSLQIKRLEQAVGATLFDRTTRRVRLTPQGEAALAHARDILALNDDLLARVAAPELAGIVRLGAPEDFATTHLPHALARFAKAFPQVQLDVTCDLTMNLIQRFDGGAFDIVLVKREPGALTEGTRVWREGLVWVGASACWRAKRDCLWPWRRRLAFIANEPQPRLTRRGGHGGRSIAALRSRAFMPRFARAWGSRFFPGA